MARVVAESRLSPVNATPKARTHPASSFTSQSMASRKGKTPDIQKRFAAHLQASINRDAWAKKGLALAKAGKKKQAQAALRKAEYWDARRRKLQQ